MEILLADLVKVIGNKYGLAFDENTLPDLTKYNIDTLPAGFLDEIQNFVLPLVEGQKESKVSLNSREELYDIVPKEYLDQINPIDDDGNRVLSISELYKAIRSQDNINGSFNSNEKVNAYREILKASYVHDDYPVMSGLERAWRLLEKDYEVVNRVEQPSDNPISSFEYYLDLGFYPPPEIMMVLADALRLYFSGSGNLSLDEILFGEKHKKTSSFAYKKHKKFKYQFFKMHLDLNRRKEGNSNLSLEAAMLKVLEETNPATLAMLGFDPDVDIDTFLRGYRRWKQDIKEGKYD